MLGRHPFTFHRAAALGLRVGGDDGDGIAICFAGLGMYSRASVKTDTLAIVILLCMTLGGGLAFLVSFVRKPQALWFLCAFWVICPLACWLALDLIVLSGAWWEWVLMLPVQMAAPLVLVWCLWRSGRRHKYVRSPAP